MKKIGIAGFFAALAAGLMMPVGAAAQDPDPSTYQLTSKFSLEARSGSLFNNAFKSANWRIENTVTASNPPNDIIYPTRNVTLKLPPKTQMMFVPPRSGPGSAECPDSKVGPGTNNSVEIPAITARCPNSIIGNGTAKFALNKNNANPDLLRNGVIVIFNGGIRAGETRVKFWAYSYETKTGVYTEGLLKPDGTLDLPFPVLTNDSGLTQLTADIPGKEQRITYPQLGIMVTLPGGQASSYVQAKCLNNSFPYSAEFLLGQRTFPGGVPFGPTMEFKDIGSNVACTGTRAVAKIGKVTVKGPARARRGKATTYSVTIPNTGGLTATNVRLSVAGRGVKLASKVPNIAGGNKRVVRIKAKFKNAGRVKASFRVSSKNAGKGSATKTITVR